MRRWVPSRVRCLRLGYALSRFWVCQVSSAKPVQEWTGFTALQQGSLARIRWLLTTYTLDAPCFSPPPVYVRSKAVDTCYIPRTYIFTLSFLAIDLITIFVPRLLESLSQRRNHLPEPIEVQDAQRRVADNIRHCEPRGHRQASRRLERGPDILIHPDALIGAPDQATGSESRDERDPVDELGRRARHAQLIHEPMNIEKRRRQLIKNEIKAVVIAEWPLGG